MTLSTQIREEVARKASMQLATDISELVMRSHDPIRIVETDADRAARLTMVEEIDARIGARFAMLVHRLGELARGDAPTTD